MRILSVQHAVPSRLVTNDQVRALVGDIGRSRGVDGIELDRIDQAIATGFAMTGSDERYTCGDDENALSIISDSVRRSLDDAGMAPEELDFLIYTGVGRGWLEPSMANAVQAAVGAVNANCFDVLDACASWLKGLHIAHTFLRSGVYHAGLIVNGELALRPFDNLEFDRVEDLEHRFAALTIGEAATATIVNDEVLDDDFYFRFETFGEHYDLCMIPLPQAHLFMAAEPDKRLQPLRFYSLSSKLITTTAKKIIDIYEADPKLNSRIYDIGFAHQASDKAAQLVRERLGIREEVYYSTHAKYGNTVSASVPLGMSLASSEGRLQRGQRVLVVVGSAGISVGFASFTF